MEARLPEPASFDVGSTKDFTPLLTGIKGSGADCIFHQAVCTLKAP